MTRDDFMSFLGKPVRFATATGGVIEGRMIAYCDTPTVEVEQADGHRISLATSVIVSALPVPCSYCKCVTADGRISNSYHKARRTVTP